MNRIEKVREYVDDILIHMEDVEERRCAYVHLYGVSQACTMIAMKRNDNVELATIAGMLHDIYSYDTMDRIDHAHNGAVMAYDLLRKMDIFDENEIDIICSAIYNHSDKHITHSAFDEILKDADVFQHYLYNPLFDVAEHEKERLERLKKEFDL